MFKRLKLRSARTNPIQRPTKGECSVAPEGKSSETFSSIAAILEFAIQREVEAARMYADLANRAGPKGPRALLLDLESEEKKHEKLLTDVLRHKLVPLPSLKVADLRISDYLVEEPVDGESSFQDLLIFAAKKEAKAAALYAELLGRSSAPEHKRLFEFLVQQEKAHKLRLEQEYEKHFLEEN